MFHDGDGPSWTVRESLVKDVKFNAAENNFNLSWEEAGETHSEIFDYVIVATGHFSVPNDPKFKGEETFTGKYRTVHFCAIIYSVQNLKKTFREIYSCS